MMRAGRAFVALLLVALGARGEQLDLTVSEPAGIRRFGYPVHATLALPRDVAGGDRFRLLADGKPVPAQLRPVPGKARSIALDFNVSLGPLEKKTYRVEYGPKGGLKLEEGTDSVVVRSGGMAYVVPRDLGGLLRQVKDGKKEYTRDGSAGLSWVQDGPGSGWAART